MRKCEKLSIEMILIYLFKQKRDKRKENEREREREPIWAFNIFNSWSIFRYK